jgi:putative DNA-invertase from lambdoid prophage Rac
MARQLIRFTRPLRDDRTGATAQAQGSAEGRYRLREAEARHEIPGRKPSWTRVQFDVVRTMLDQHQGVRTISKATDLSRQTIYRIERDRAAAEKVLATWSQ